MRYQFHLLPSAFRRTVWPCSNARTSRKLAVKGYHPRLFADPYWLSVVSSRCRLGPRDSSSSVRSSQSDLHREQLPRRNTLLRLVLSFSLLCFVSDVLLVWRLLRERLRVRRREFSPFHADRGAWMLNRCTRHAPRFVCGLYITDDGWARILWNHCSGMCVACACHVWTKSVLDRVLNRMESFSIFRDFFGYFSTDSVLFEYRYMASINIVTVH